MSKWYGKIGYAEHVESKPGKWIEDITERPYFGDLIRNTRKFQNSGSVNGEVDIANDISIVADPYAFQHFHKIRYVEFMGGKYIVSNVEVQYPRLILTLGGLYNGR